MLLGLLNFILPVLVCIPLVGYLAQTDVPGLNFIQENYMVLHKVVSDSLKSHDWTADKYMDIMRQLEDLFPTLVLTCTIYAGVTALFSFLMVLGVRCETKCLMIPFLVLSMIDIILAGAAGVVVVVALFTLNYIPGAVSLVVYIMVAVVSLYSWAVILAAYKQVSNDEYVYSPVGSVKPSYHQPEYYPSAPQHFVMEEYRDLRNSKNH